MCKKILSSLVLSLIMGSSISIVNSMDDVNSNKSHNDELCMKLCSTIGDVMYENYKLLGDEVVDISGMSKQDIQKMVDNCTRKVKYNPKKMWFDYQALFDKTRNKILGKTDDIKVRYINLKRNNAARHGIFFCNKIDMNLLHKALDGDLDNQSKIIENIGRYYWSYDKYVDCTQEICYSKLNHVVYKNYLYLLTIGIALGKYCGSKLGYYFSIANHDYIPTYFHPNSLENKNNKLIENINFYAITRPIMGSMFFDQNFY